MSSRPSVSHSVIPTERKRTEGSPELEDVLSWGFLALLEMTGRRQEQTLIRQPAELSDTFPSEGKAGGRRTISGKCHAVEGASPLTPLCHPDRAKRAEGSPKLEDVLSWGFLALLEMTGKRGGISRSYGLDMTGKKGR